MFISDDEKSDRAKALEKLIEIMDAQKGERAGKFGKPIAASMTIEKVPLRGDKTPMMYNGGEVPDEERDESPDEDDDMSWDAGNHGDGPNEDDTDYASKEGALDPDEVRRIRELLSRRD